MSGAPVIVIAGPTASGKSDLAIRVAEAVAGNVINADSMQVYRDLRVLTARPDAEDEARVPHHLFGYRDAADHASAADWRDDARAAISAVHAQGRRPVVVGGTGLYLRTVMKGIAPVPAIPDGVRTRARARREEIGAEAFFAELEMRDPVIAVRLHARDSQRVLRAWEVHEATGRPLSAWQDDPVEGPDLDFRVIVLEPDREALYGRIDARFARMLDAGALDEVRALAKKAEDEGLDPALPVFKALGYPELSAYLRGVMSLDEAAAQSAQQTRNYAKRQMTWLRTQLRVGERISVLKQCYVNKAKIFSFIS